jgi:hypothetical protein
MAVQIQQLLGAAFLIVLAIMLTVFACTIIPDPKNPLIVLGLVFYMFAPVPFALCGLQQQQGFTMLGNQESPLLPISHFLTGMFFTAGPCLAVVLYHTGSVSATAMGMSFGSGALLLCAVYVLMKGSAPRDESQDM